MSTWALGGELLQNHHIYVCICMHISTHSALVRTSETTTTSLRNCSTILTTWWGHFQSLTASPHPFLCSSSSLLYVPNAIVINFLLGRCLLVKGPIYLSYYRDRSLLHIPHPSRHLGIPHLYLPVRWQLKVPSSKKVTLSWTVSSSLPTHDHLNSCISYGC